MAHLEERERLMDIVGLWASRAQFQILTLTFRTVDLFNSREALVCGLFTVSTNCGLVDIIVDITWIAHEEQSICRTNSDFILYLTSRAARFSCWTSVDTETVSCAHEKTGHSIPATKFR
jgi:hypothetical protein